MLTTTPCWAHVWVDWTEWLRKKRRAGHKTFKQQGAGISSTNQRAPHNQRSISGHGSTGYIKPPHCTADHQWVRPWGLHVTRDKTPNPWHENALCQPCQQIETDTNRLTQKTNWLNDKTKTDTSRLLTYWQTKQTYKGLTEVLKYIQKVSLTPSSTNLMQHHSASLKYHTNCSLVP